MFPSTRSALGIKTKLQQKFWKHHQQIKEIHQPIPNKPEVLPPHTITKRETNIFCFHPTKRCDLDFLKELHCCFCCVCKESLVSFIPKDPNTTKPNQMKERPPGSITTWRVNKLIIMLYNLLRVHKKHTNPSLSVAKDCQRPDNGLLNDQCFHFVHNQ